VASGDDTVSIGMFIAIAREKTQKRSLWIDGDEGGISPVQQLLVVDDVVMGWVGLGF
jgi:hypothetical protein